jgi:two-component system, LuxR family, response regulator FixJ
MPMPLKSAQPSWSDDFTAVVRNEMAKKDPTVFIVDDDAAVRSSLCWLISSLNLPVQAFPSALDFLDAVEPTRSGCVIVDVKMPGMSGFRLQHEIRDRYPNLSTIIMSAYGSPDTAARAVADGALAYVEKPVNDEVLIDLIRKGIDRSSENSREQTLPI